MPRGVWRSAPAYVALTRHREEVALFVARNTAKDVSELARQVKNQMMIFQTSIATLYHVAPRTSPFSIAGTDRPSRSKPSGPRRSSPSSRAINRTVRGFGRGALPPLASREFKRYFISVERRVR